MVTPTIIAVDFGLPLPAVYALAYATNSSKFSITFSKIQ